MAAMFLLRLVSGGEKAGSAEAHLRFMRSPIREERDPLGIGDAVLGGEAAAGERKGDGVTVPHAVEGPQIVVLPVTVAVEWDGPIAAPGRA